MRARPAALLPLVIAALEVGQSAARPHGWAALGPSSFHVRQWHQLRQQSHRWTQDP